ncbi:hypothetical protein PAXRUDRAFT_18300 [Paxillus rubicundulus Ve08.2h10]|uniref:Uncharacterized protein n=1 Tax=Paxillus rubicundulus Ve08.2h10 TaxID=930991 RepID=A0A0D0DF75_9AGAM|nr:hypothetical protein PAXRUDRAFT_18300 [Paxillus rubicundulus Ve08.2h10]
MVINDNAETTPHQSSSLTPPLPSSPMQAPSALPSPSKDDTKNEHCHLCLDGGKTYIAAYNAHKLFVMYASQSWSRVALLSEGVTWISLALSATKLQIGITVAKWDRHLPHTG